MDGHDLVGNERRRHDRAHRDEALERLHKNFYPLWKTLKEAEAGPSLLDRWRDAPSGSVEWRKGVQLRAALRVLDASMSD